MRKKIPVEAESRRLDSNIASILGVNVAISPRERVLRKIEEVLAKKLFSRPFFVVTVNPEFVMEAQKDSEFKSILNSADLAVPDGNGLKLTDLRIQVYPGRVLVADLLKNPKMKVFYLGGKDGVASDMANKYGGESDEGSPDIKFEIRNPKSERNSNLQIINRINKYRPDLLLVAYGHPWQEKWIYRNLDKLHCKAVMGVGGTFDYLTGRSSVPPTIVSKMGLEWLWRLAHEPWRWKRQLKLIKYLLLIFRLKNGN